MATDEPEWGRADWTVGAGHWCPEPEVRRIVRLHRSFDSLDADANFRGAGPGVVVHHRGTEAQRFCSWAARVPVGGPHSPGGSKAQTSTLCLGASVVNPVGYAGWTKAHPRASAAKLLLDHA